MLGRKGQAFDAFKLLIAAVVAGAILVIIMSMLGGFITPVNKPVQVMSQLVQGIKSNPGTGVLSSQVVQFKEGETISAASVWDAAGLNPGSVGFCGGSSGCTNSECGDGNYTFSSTYFTVTHSTDYGDQVTLKGVKQLNGYIWVFNTGAVGDKPHFCIGFKIQK